MKEGTAAAAENQNRSENLQAYHDSVENRFGELDYDFLEGDDEKNPIFIFPGFPLGTDALAPFAQELNKAGKTVIAPNKLHLKHLKATPTFDKEAELFASIIEEEGLEHLPLDAVIHSNGALLFERLVKVAAERGWTCFREDTGAKSVWVAPTGSNAGETRRKFIPRYVEFFKVGAPRDKALDKNNELFKKNFGVVVKNPRKTIGEVLPILRDKIDFIKLGEIASKPFILQYPKDPLFPYKVISETVFPDGLDSTDGLARSVSTPVNLAPGLGKSLEELREIADEDQTDDEIAEYYYSLSHTARHDDLVFNPKSTANAVLKLLNR